MGVHEEVETDSEEEDEDEEMDAEESNSSSEEDEEDNDGGDGETDNQFRNKLKAVLGKFLQLRMCVRVRSRVLTLYFIHTYVRELLALIFSFTPFPRPVHPRWWA